MCGGLPRLKWRQFATFLVQYGPKRHSGSSADRWLRTFASDFKTERKMERINRRIPDCNLQETSLIKMYEDSFRRHWLSPALSDYRGERISYGELARRVARMHVLFENAGIVRGDKIALCGKNSLAWGVSFLSVLTYGAVPVPILNDFKPGNIHTIVNHSEARLLMVGDVVLSGMDPAGMPGIDGMILMNDMSCRFSRSGLLERAFENLDATFAVKYAGGFTKSDVCYEAEESPESLAVLNYTSGTTSEPKGVMIPYRALLANMKFACATLPLVEGETVVSMLPMAHMFGLAFQLMFELLTGAGVCYLGRTPTPKTLFAAFAEEKPKLVITVPLVVEKVIRQKVQPLLGKPLMKIAMAIPGLRALVGGKIRRGILDAFGGNVDSLIIGGAALNADVEKILRQIRFPYTVGYGSTECAPLVSYADWERYAPGSCGVPIAGCTVSVFSDNPSSNVGELLVKGDNVMLGYYKNPNATRDAIDPEGWFHTGDMGLIDGNGNIFIKGRCKNMILGPSGQNIYPEEIEDMINNLPLVVENLVVERDRKLVALVLPDFEAMKAAGLSSLDLAAKMEDERRRLNGLLPSYSQISKFQIRTEPFERTPKNSIRRFLYK